MFWFGLSWNNLTSLSTTTCYFSTFITFLKAGFKQHTPGIFVVVYFSGFGFEQPNLNTSLSIRRVISFTVSVRTWAFPFILLWLIFTFLSSVSSYSLSTFSICVKLPFKLFFTIASVKISLFFHPITLLSQQNSKTISLPHQDLTFALSLYPARQTLRMFWVPHPSNYFFFADTVLATACFLVLLFCFKNPYYFLNIYVTNFIIHFSMFI